MDKRLPSKFIKNPSRRKDRTRKALRQPTSTHVEWMSYRICDRHDVNGTKLSVIQVTGKRDRRAGLGVKSMLLELLFLVDVCCCLTVEDCVLLSAFENWLVPHHSDS
jgi:hypothetical protein